MLRRKPWKSWDGPKIMLWMLMVVVAPCFIIALLSGAPFGVLLTAEIVLVPTIAFGIYVTCSGLFALLDLKHKD